MNRLRVIVASVVTGVWGLGYALSYFTEKVKAPAESTPIMLGVVAFIFAREVRAAAKKALDEAPGGEG